MQQKVGNVCLGHMSYICHAFPLQSVLPCSTSTLRLLFGYLASQLAICWLEFDILNPQNTCLLHHRVYPRIMASNPNQDRYQCTADPSHSVAQAGTRCSDCIVRANGLALSSLLLLTFISHTERWRQSRGKPPLSASCSKAARLLDISSNMKRGSISFVMPRSSVTCPREPARFQYYWTRVSS